MSYTRHFLMISPEYGLLRGKNVCNLEALQSIVSVINNINDESERSILNGETG